MTTHEAEYQSPLNPLVQFDRLWKFKEQTGSYICFQQNSYPSLQRCRVDQNISRNCFHKMPEAPMKLGHLKEHGARCSLKLKALC